MTETTTTWRSRITGYGEADPKTLRPHPGNWRIHPTKQRRAMSDALDEIGWLQGVLVNQRTNQVVDGHMRLDMALRTGAATIPVTYIDLSPAEEATVLATLDPLATLAGMDPEKQAAIAALVATDRDALRALIGLEPALTDREALEHDHTAAFFEDDDPDDGETYGAPPTAIRLIQFIMTEPEYQRVVADLDRIAEREGHETNADTVLWLLETYEP